jgi:desulfoferrodoxin (superoxide reductase-like protein)
MMMRRDGFLKFEWSVVLILLTVFCLYPQTSFATSPKDVKLEYDANAQMLTVTVTHKTSSPNYHYIKYVEIKKGGEVVSNNKYENQPDQEIFTYKYKVTAAEGETIEVTATCSIIGSKTAQLTVNKAALGK